MIGEKFTLNVVQLDGSTRPVTLRVELESSPTCAHQYVWASADGNAKARFLFERVEGRCVFPRDEEDAKRAQRHFAKVEHEIGCVDCSRKTTWH